MTLPFFFLEFMTGLASAASLFQLAVGLSLIADPKSCFRPRYVYFKFLSGEQKQEFLRRAAEAA